jgi:uncharacterized protein YbjT (DUF2867 family)
MIAAVDVAREAAGHLLNGWQGRSTIELHGPADLSFAEAATILASALGRTVMHVRVDEDEAWELMRRAGLSHEAAHLMLELYHGIETGALSPSTRRSFESTTPTSLADFARTALAPRLTRAVG